MSKPKFSYEWGDPAKVAEIHERQELKGCQGCIHKLILWGVQVCTKQPGLAGNQMRKCEHFAGRIFE